MNDADHYLTKDTYQKNMYTYVSDESDKEN